MKDGWWVKDIELMINTALKDVSDEYVGKRVRLKHGRYAERIAQIDGVIHHGSELQFLCMVLRTDGKGFLNTDPDTRRYRPFSDFTVLS